MAFGWDPGQARVKKHVKWASGSFSFLPFSATFCRFKPVKTGKWQKTLFAGRNANPNPAFNRADQHLVKWVQRRATEMVPELRQLPYPLRLRALKLPLLYHRRRRGDMIAVYQLLHGGLDLDPQDFFDTALARDTLGHPWRVVKPRAVSRIRRNTFSVWVVNDWNSLPPEIVASETMNQFKNRLDSHWLSTAYTIPHTHG